MRKLGDNIKEAQEKKQLSTLQLSKRTGINRHTLCTWRQAKYAHATSIINRLCKELEITPNELLNYGEYEW